MPNPKRLEAVRPLRILVLEDHIDTHNGLLLYLETAGHLPDSAFTVTNARQRLEATYYDVFISDLGLPDGDGWELMRTVKWFHPAYAIAISGYGSQEDRARSEAVGFRRHLIKPCKLHELDAALREAAREAIRPGGPGVQ